MVVIKCSKIQKCLRKNNYIKSCSHHDHAFIYSLTYVNTCPLTKFIISGIVDVLLSQLCLLHRGQLGLYAALLFMNTAKDTDVLPPKNEDLYYTLLHIIFLPSISQNIGHSLSQSAGTDFLTVCLIIIHNTANSVFSTMMTIPFIT